MSGELMNDFQRGEQVREIAGQVFQHFKDNQKEEAIGDLVKFATIINSRNISGYTKIEHTEAIKSNIKNFESDFNAKLDKLDIKIDQVEERLSNKINNLDTKIDQVEERLNHKIEQVEERLNHKIEQVEERLDNKISSLDIKIDQMDERLNNKIDQMDERLNNKIDQVALSLKSTIENKILESQNSLIKWFVGMVLAQSTGMVYLFLKLSGKF